jgi:hypothetical protein
LFRKVRSNHSKCFAHHPLLATEIGTFWNCIFPMHIFVITFRTKLFQVHFLFSSILVPFCPTQFHLLDLSLLDDQMHYARAHRVSRSSAGIEGTIFEDNRNSSILWFCHLLNISKWMRQRKKYIYRFLSSNEFLVMTRIRFDFGIENCLLPLRNAGLLTCKPSYCIEFTTSLKPRSIIMVSSSENQFLVPYNHCFL